MENKAAKVAWNAAYHVQAVADDMVKAVKLKGEAQRYALYKIQELLENLQGYLTKQAKALEG